MSRMSPRFVVWALLTFCGAAALVLAAAAPRPVDASGPLFTEFPCPSNPTFMCVMSGLHNPRGLAFDQRRRDDDDDDELDGDEMSRDEHENDRGGQHHAQSRRHDEHDGDDDSAHIGALYVAEAGCGGNTSDCQSPAPPSSCKQLPFAGSFVTRCFGLTGSISRLWNGTQERVATGFPSHAGPLGDRAIGPNDVSLRGVGNLYATIGEQYDPTARAQWEIGPLFAQLVHVPARALTAKSKHIERRVFSPDWLVADIGDFEVASNPDHGGLDTNPYGLLSVQRGWIVTDAGGNSLLKVDRQGNVSLLATFQTPDSNPPRPSFAPPPFTQFTEPLPTTVVVGPDGAYYVGELTGVPMTDTRANVYRVVPGDAPREFFIEDAFLTGFKTIIDMAFDDEGNLYVLQLSTGAVQMAGPGVLIRVTPDKEQPDIYAQYRNGTRTTVLSGLLRPTSVAVGPDGALYISRGITIVGGGEVIRFVPPPQ